MSCMIALLQGGKPEIFPIPIADMEALIAAGAQAFAVTLGRQPSSLAPPASQYVGAALLPDGNPFYLTTLAPELAPSLAAPWQGAFYAPFGIGDIVGSVSGDPGATAVSTLKVDAKLLVEGNEEVAANWVVRGTKLTTPNKAALIGPITISRHGPHQAEDIRRCIALHAPQRVFGEPRAVVAMQCGVAAACLLEAIC
jgi:hypothetical protein